ncbi:MAG: CPBP family intramembrane glutamic endopeptidase [Chloroflexota bacterium]
MENAETLRPLMVFVGVTYGLSILLSIVIGLTGGKDSNLIGLGFGAFFFPAIAVLVVRYGFDARIADAGWRKFSIIWLLAALFIIPITIHTVTLPVTALLNDFTLPWQGWLTPAADGLYYSPEERGWGILTRGELTNRLLLNAVVGILIVSLLAFFEEIGWRAWMLPRLTDQFGVREGVLIGSAIWAFWHIPFVLAGIHHFDGVPIWLAVLFSTLGFIGAGNVLGWLWMGSGSIWIITLAHGALNNWGQFAFKFMTDAPELTGSNENLILFITLNTTLFVLGMFFLFRLSS